MKAGSLFSGYGGLDLAVEEVFGAQLTWYAEFDPAPGRIMDSHWPDVPNHGDVTAVDWSAVEPVDIVSGGSPCQDVSAAGRRAGMNEGTRSNLWVAMREAIATIKPTYVIWENVRGAHSAAAYSEVEQEPGLLGDTRDTHLRATGRVLGDLASLGFDAEWRTISASSVGAPHKRERVFVLAWRRDATVAHSHGRRDGRGNAPPGQGGRERADTTPVIATGAPGVTGTAEEVELLPTVLANEYDGNASEGNLNRNTVPLKAVVHLLPTPVAQPPGNTPEDHLRKKPGRERVTDLGIIVENGLLATGGKLLPTPNAYLVSKGGSQHPDKVRAGGHMVDLTDVTEHEISHTDFGPYDPAVRRWEKVLGRPAPPPTELSPRGRHRLSEHFTEWLMGLPAGWICDTPGVSRSDAIKAAGNGVVPQQAIAALQDMQPFADAEGFLLPERRRS